ncbi:MAG: terminase family protein [Alistipes sp.]|uniref:terminase family protein n=1 Tax=Alistipes sp. TaxID=1872444 RepID=UPI0011CA6F9D
MKELLDTSNLDPVFLSVGQEVYTNEYVQQLREENIRLKAEGKEIYNHIPQEGFQEEVTIKDADFLLIGGKRGGGKSYISQYICFNYIENPQASMYAFRKLEDDIERGPWKTSRQLFTGFGLPTKSNFTWEFTSGATLKMEHLQDPKKIKDRFRGAEMPLIIIDELPEHTVEDMSVVFTLLGSNRNTIGVKSRLVGTCNPVGKSNSLRLFVDWYIDPDTNRVIPERSGQIRYFHCYGTTVKDIAWGNTRQEVYDNPNAKHKIDQLCRETGKNPFDFITSFCFIEGNYIDNKILEAADPTYMNRVSSQGGADAIKDIAGIWEDCDDGTALITSEDMHAVFDSPVEHRDGTKRASADVALTGDFFVIFAADGHHLCDVEAWQGIPTNRVVPFVRNFLEKNGVREENFTYDMNGLGLWLKDDFPRSIGFNNKSTASNSQLWDKLKSECADKFVQSLHLGEWSIDQKVLNKVIKDKKGIRFTIRDRLLLERLAIRSKETDNGRFEIITKQQMKQIIGHSPDFIEAWMMFQHLITNKKPTSRKGLWMLA